MEAVDEAQFIQLAGEALDLLQEELGELLDNVIIAVEDEHPEEDLFGLYEGVPLTERGHFEEPMLPDQITLYRLTLCDAVADLDELREEVAITVIHEVAHHFGIEDDRLHELGWG